MVTALTRNGPRTVHHGPITVRVTLVRSPVRVDKPLFPRPCGTSSPFAPPPRVFPPRADRAANLETTDTMDDLDFNTMHSNAPDGHREMLLANEGTAVYLKKEPPLSVTIHGNVKCDGLKEKAPPKKGGASGSEVMA